MELEIEKCVFTIIDFESTGLEINSDNRIVEIGAIKTKNSKEIDRFHSLVNPEIFISEGAYSVHGISNEMVSNQPNFKSLVPQLLSFIDGTIVVAHNTYFDVRILNSELERTGFEKYTLPTIDTVRLARKAFGELPRHNLNALRVFFEIQSDVKHRSIADCEATVIVFWKSVNRLRNIGKVKDVTDMLQVGRNSKLAQEMGLKTS